MEMVFWAPDPPESPALPPVEPAVLAERAVDSLELKLAEVHTAPEAPGPTLVNLETWLWVSDADWRTLTASASARGTTASVTAKPVRVEWDLGEDTHTCDGPGREWRKGLGPDDATCYYRYAHTSEDQPKGQYTISAAIVYDVTWTCEGQCRATSGQLGEYTAPQGTASLGVKEAVPVLTGQR
ncbi:MAG: hypothetical protein GEU93_17285 [Propionibacteriales bacterium]|nr:hypothetical protein [Propionibacteriales bacterium]